MHVAEHPRGELSLWVEVDPAQPRVEREFCVAGTGWQIVADDPLYVGTAVMRDGLVFHVFETFSAPEQQDRETT